jgi:hypothetical protein
MAPHIARFRTLGHRPSRRTNADIQGIVPLEVVGSHKNSALLAAHRRWVARSR